jgi:citronellyl-CoA dehydrogenase
LRKIIEQDINPYVDEWEEARIYPAHKIMKKLGDAGILGVSHPTEFGGLGLGKLKISKNQEIIVKK